MKKVIDIDALLVPIPGENPAGEDLRYSSIYDDLKEARRADDSLNRGDWQREIKTSDWDRVITIAVEALAKKSKDLQIAAWLMEALIYREGFSGVAAGLRILFGLLRDHWEHVYPAVEEGDLDFRAAPLQFVNDKFWPSLKQISLTDASAGPGYSWLQWQESRQVGFESETLNRSGEVDESKKKRRDELIAEKKLTAEEFDSAVARSSKAFYQSLAEDLTLSLETFKKLDGFVDEKFGSQAPRLADFGKALDDCAEVVMKIHKEKKGPEPVAEVKVQAEKVAIPKPPEQREIAVLPLQVGESSDSDFLEKAVWKEALQILKDSGIKEALAKLLGASNSAPSVRSRSRYRLWMAKLCLEADRPDLARPIVEELNHLIEELHLERWESPLWMAEVLDALYQCLMRGAPSDEDKNRGKALFQKICTTDVTKAMNYKP